ncbi:hypothetical protein Cadr_000003355, partial [Camelus dromedarius]
PTVISNLRMGATQLQVRTLDLVKPKRMKEHLQLKVKEKERGMRLVGMCVCGGVCVYGLARKLINGKWLSQRLGVSVVAVSMEETAKAEPF